MGPHFRSKFLFLGLLLTAFTVLPAVYIKFNTWPPSIDEDHAEKLMSSPARHERSHVGMTSERIVGPRVICHDKSTESKIQMRGPYWVLYNYVRSGKQFHCNETITFTTHGDWRFLDNLGPLLKRWQGPVSVAMYTPGQDYQTTLQFVMYLRKCSREAQIIRDFATFHFFFDSRFVPSRNQFHAQFDPDSFQPNCTEELTSSMNKTTSFKDAHNLDYPINVARNIARETANSYFIFPSDIELYPSPDMIPNFLDMMRRNPSHIPTRTNRKVFVNAIFEIQKGHDLPRNKSGLVSMIEEGIVVPFHQHICSNCHKLPESEGWEKEGSEETMSTLTIAKRNGPFFHWEPIYIGTHWDPLYDERLSWEGRADKMTQGYQMCVLDYDFHVLSNAFLIHRPGIKTNVPVETEKQKLKVRRQTKLINEKIRPELEKIFGKKKGCQI